MLQSGQHDAPGVLHAEPAGGTAEGQPGPGFSQYQ
jgi:hypothetical protein